MFPGMLKVSAKAVTLLLMLLLVTPSGLHLQAQSGFWHKADSLLTKLRTNNADTLYLTRPQQHWTLKLMGGMSNNSSYFSGRDQENPLHDTYWSGSPRKTITLSANYRGLGLSVAVNPAKIGQGFKALRLNVVTYSNRYGFDILYEHEGHLREKHHPILNSQDGTVSGGMTQKILTMFGYYVLNAKKFSYPAAFTQTWIQRKSAGSVILGANFQKINSSFDELTREDLSMRSFDVRTLSVGAGYGYNLVYKSWLIHASGIPTLTLWNEKVAHNLRGNEVMQTYFPEFVLKGTLAVVNNYDRYFWGMNLMWIYSFNRMTERSHFWNGRWKARVLFGVRF